MGCQNTFSDPVHIAHLSHPHPVRRRNLIAGNLTCIEMPSLYWNLKTLNPRYINMAFIQASKVAVAEKYAQKMPLWSNVLSTYWSLSSKKLVMSYTIATGS